MTLHDIFGTPYQLPIKVLKDGELIEEVILLSPPTVKFYETLLANYAMTIDDVMNSDADIQDAKALVKLMSKTMQMVHIAASMQDPEVTFETVEYWFQSDPTIMVNYLNSLKNFLPEVKKAKPGRKVVNPKQKTQPKKVWIPK